jgi:hypothetical protein
MKGSREAPVLDPAPVHFEAIAEYTRAEKGHR